MVYTPVVAGLAAALSWGTADYLSRYQSQKVGHYRAALYSQFVTFLFLLLLIPVFGLSPAPTLYPLLALLAAGCVNFAAFIFLYRAFHKGVISVVAPIAYTYPVTTVILSTLVLGAVLSPVRILAIAAVIVGVVLLSTRLSEIRTYFGGKGAPNLTAGVGSAIVCAILFGTVYVGIGYAAPLVSLIIPALVLRSVGAGLGFALAPVLHYDPRPSRLVVSNTIILIAALEVIGLLTFTYGVFTAGASLPVVTALSSMGGAVAAFYGFLLLKERLELNQILGVVVALAAVFTLLYLGE